MTKTKTPRPQHRTTKLGPVGASPGALTESQLDKAAGGLIGLLKTGDAKP